MAKRKRKKTANKDNLTIVILIIVSILLGFLIYTKSGAIGQGLSEVLGGMMGVSRLFLPIGILGVAIKLACANNEYVTSKLVKFGIILISLSVVMSVFQISGGELNPNKEMGEAIKDAYYTGSQGNGGGALGALLAIPLAKLIGNVGTIILFIGVALVLAVNTFGINLAEMINILVEKHQDKAQVKHDEKVELREKQRAEREKIREQREIERAKKAELDKQNKEQRRMQLKDLEIDDDENEPEQIKINFGGKLLNGKDDKKLKKFKHNADDLVPIGMEKKEHQPDVIENNLFKQEEEQKEDKTKEVLQLEHTITVEDENYEYPPVEILSKGTNKGLKGGAKALTDTATKLQKTLYSFGVSAKVENVSVGPAITRYELKPAEGVRVSKIANLADDIALNLAAETIRIEAPIPGKKNKLYI